MKKLLLNILILLSFTAHGQNKIIYKSGYVSYEDLLRNALFNYKADWIMDKISYPVNHGSMKGYHDANYFQHALTPEDAGHLGADVNGLVQGNSDLGDTIYCIGKGRVIEVYENSIIMILHKTSKGYIVSQYRHCLEAFVYPGQYLERVQPIGRIGNDNGIFLAHLHFEIRTDYTLGILGGYGDPEGFVDPMKYIKNFGR